MAKSEEDLSSVVYYRPDWIAQAGGWIHSNNVLFYFAESPFFDRTSVNQSLITQSQGIPEREFENLSTRQRFESKLAQLTGLQYIVVHDPLQSNAKFKGPDGEEQSDVWVIQRQYRHKIEGRDDDVTVTGYYYILNQAIYQAPSVASVLSYRLMNTTLAMNQIFSTASALPNFSVSHGHTYHKPVQKPITALAASTGPSKDPTPMPDSQRLTSDGVEAGNQSKDFTDANATTLREALSLSMRYGKEYMDDMPLMGEPGNFRFTKNKDPSSTGGHLAPSARSQAPFSKAATPTPAAKATSPPPTIQTNVPAVISKKSSAKSPKDNPMKPKRRKSKPANQTP